LIKFLDLSSTPNIPRTPHHKTSGSFRSSWTNIPALPRGLSTTISDLTSSHFSWIKVFSNAGMSLNGEFEAGSADGSFSG
jgi:hypothetical protein